MNGREILVDTNILPYLLNGNNTLQQILQGKTIYLSFITELELIGFKQTDPSEERLINKLLNDCIIVALNNKIKNHYAEVRRLYNLKLADSVIAATAIALNLPLITADKQFVSVKELMLIKFEV